MKAYVANFTEDIGKQKSRRLLEMSENPDSSTISTERISRAARTSSYVFLLYLRSPENAKNVERERERKRERDISMRHSLCFHNRTASSTWGLLHVPESSSFPKYRLLGFLLPYAAFSLFYGERFGSVLFGLPSFLPRRSRSTRLTAQIRRVQPHDSHLIGHIILREKGKQRVVDTSD